MGRFSQSLKMQAALVMSGIVATHKNVISSLIENVNDRSPVGNPALWENPVPPPNYKPGHYAMNWQLTQEKNVEEIEGFDPEKKTAIARNKESLKGMTLGGFLYLSNAVPYAQRLEEGHSSQAPLGVAKLAVMDAESRLQRFVP